MKNFRPKYPIAKLSIILLLLNFLSCEKLTEPSTQKLVIADGFYKKIKSASSGLECAVEFEYYVVGTECKIGGYSIRWDDHKTGRVDWYMMQTIKPGQRYSIRDTFKLSDDSSLNPIVSMAGYFDSERLYAECRLLRGFFEHSGP